MIPVAFPEINILLGKPSNMTAEECGPLYAHIGKTPDGHQIIVSCWKLTEEELEEFNKTKKIWLWVYGDGHPPVILSAESPFVG